MKALKTISTIVAVLFAVIVFATWQYRLTCFLTCIIINRKWILTKVSKKVYRLGISILSLAIIMSIPNFFSHGRTQAIFLDAKGKETHPPLSVYLVNAILPEEELMNIAIKLNAITNLTDGKLFIDARNDFWRGRCLDFYKPYSTLSLQGSNPGSLAEMQGINQIFGTNYDGIYVTKPKHFDKDCCYPIVIFAHGFLGNWELYQGIFSKLENCVIISIGTRNLSGVFNKKHIDKIFNRYIPIIERHGIKVDHSKINLIGLSNGGTCSNIALQDYASKFNTITFISAPCNVIKRLPCKVILIGGGHDAASKRMPSTQKQLINKGTRTSMYYKENENHFILVYKLNEITQFLNQELELQ